MYSVWFDFELLLCFLTSDQWFTELSKMELEYFTYASVLDMISI